MTRTNERKYDLSSINSSRYPSHRKIKRDIIMEESQKFAHKIYTDLLNAGFKLERECNFCDSRAFLLTKTIVPDVELAFCKECHDAWMRDEPRTEALNVLQEWWKETK